jgi:hypothetical protein
MLSYSIEEELCGPQNETEAEHEILEEILQHLSQDPDILKKSAATGASKYSTWEKVLQDRSSLEKN